jgi:hypothetical protein
MSGILMASSGNYVSETEFFVGDVINTVGTTELVIPQNFNSVKFDAGGELWVNTADTNLNLSGVSYTIECWIRPSSTGISSVNEKIICSYLGGSDGRTQYSLYLLNGLLTAKLHTGNGNYTTITSTVKLSADIWVHVALTYTAPTTRLYMGGQLIASSNTAISTTNSTKFVIGGNSTATGFFDGHISNLRVVKNGNVLPTASSFTPMGQSLTYAPYIIYPHTGERSENPITSILTCQGSAGEQTFIDNSGNNLTINKSSSGVTATVLSPFINTTTNNGSSYFFSSGYVDVVSGSVSNYTFNLEANDFTIELWMYTDASPSSGMILIDTRTGNSNGYVLNTNSNRTITLNRWGATILTSSERINLSCWNHIAAVRSGNEIRIYVNGVSSNNTTGITGTTTFTVPGSILRIGQKLWASSGVGNFVGYISDVRILKGTALYVSNFTPPTTRLQPINNTILLTLQTPWRPVDNSVTNAIVQAYNTVRSDVFSPTSSAAFYRNWSTYFNGNGDYLTIPTNAAFSFDTGDFTIECWVYLNTKTGYPVFAMLGDGVDATPTQRLCAWSLYFDGGANQLVFARYTPTYAGLTFSWNPSLNQWYHVCLTRGGTSLRAFVNGTQIGTTQSNNTNYTAVNSTSLHVGRFIANGGVSFFLNGYISNLRIVKGTAVYTSNFTPSSSPLTAITNTALLTCQNGYPVDVSSNKFSITINSNPLPVQFSPFNVETTSTVDVDYVIVGGGGGGGSGVAGGGGGGGGVITGSTTVTPGTKIINVGAGGLVGENGKASIIHLSPYYGASFVGSNSYLSVPTNSAFGFGTGDFTIEFWAKWDGKLPTSAVNGGTFIDLRAAVGAESTAIFLSTGGALQYYNGPANLVYGSTAFTTNVWNHVALTRQSGVWRIFLNGIEATGTHTSASDLGTTKPVLIGQGINGSTTSFSGLISSLRIIKGTALYTANFVPSGGRLSTINNTVLLTAQELTAIPQPVNYSILFNGSSYLSIPKGPAHEFGSTPFTVEGWINAPNVSTVQGILGNFQSVAGGGWRVVLSSGYISYYQTGGGQAYSNTTILPNTWNHFAVVGDGSTIRMFLNGILGEVTCNQLSTITSQGHLVIGLNPDTLVWLFNGYMSNIRIVKGTALYSANSANFIPPISALTTIENTTLLTCSGTSIIDSSTNNLALTVNGSATVDVNTPYGTETQRWSTYFDGAGDYMSTGSNTAFNFGTGDFTVEFWVNSADVSSATQRGILQTSTTNGGLMTSYGTGITVIQGLSRTLSNLTGSLIVNVAGTWVGPTIAVMTANTWNHVAIARVSGTATLYINGTSVDSRVAAEDITATNIAIGGYYSTSYLFRGYLSNLRVVKSTAVYTANFTPSTTPLSATVNTTLLTCQGALFVDNSTNNLSFTARADVRPILSSPFTSTAVTTQSRSVFFDGTGDYLSTSNSTAFNFGTGDFTVEGWVYLTTTENRGIFQLSGNSIGLNASASNTIGLYVDNVAGAPYSVYWAGTAANTGATAVINVWTHFALIRRSGRTTVYINGVPAASRIDTTNYSCTGVAIGGYYSTSYLLKGYISNFRVVKGRALYIDSIAPTSSLTAIANTTLLTANAEQIVDGSNNNLTITKVSNPTVVTVGPFGSATPDPFLDGSITNATITTVGPVSKVLTSPTFEAYGGGSGGNWLAYNSATSGLSGASGGGAVGYYMPTGIGYGATSPGAGFSTQGNSGGTATPWSACYVHRGAGGGGAGAVGGNTLSCSAGDGGLGRLVSFTNKYYGGGGGGGVSSDNGYSATVGLNGLGGIGGGGNGHRNTVPAVAATNGQANTGGGGGGGGGLGGSGTVIIRYKSKITDTVFDKPGTYYYVVPDGVYNVSVVCVGAGSGRGLAVKAGDSTFGTTEVIGYGANGTVGGSYVGTGGANGGNGGDTYTVLTVLRGGSGGGAAGYRGNGGVGLNPIITTPLGGLGVGIYGIGSTSGNAVADGGGGGGGGSSPFTQNGYGSWGGSFGTQYWTNSFGGLFGGGAGGYFASTPAAGGGGGGLGWKNNIVVTPGQIIPIVVGNGIKNYNAGGGGAWGAVRVISGSGRSFPDASGPSIQSSN